MYNYSLTYLDFGKFWNTILEAKRQEDEQVLAIFQILYLSHIANFGMPFMWSNFWMVK